jgi:hypothetical protein
VVLVPGWHVPLLSQQPMLHESCVHIAAPPLLLDAEDPPEDPLEEPELLEATHEPSLHVVFAPQLTHAPPPVPHTPSRFPSSHVPDGSQQPLHVPEQAPPPPPPPSPPSSMGEASSPPSSEGAPLEPLALDPEPPASSAGDEPLELPELLVPPEDPLAPCVVDPLLPPELANPLVIWLFVGSPAAHADAIATGTARNRTVDTETRRRRLRSRAS